MLKSNFFYMLAALVAECCLVYSSVLVKISQLPSINLGFYRILLATPIFFIFSAYKGTFKKVKFTHAIYMIFAGVMFGIDVVFFNISLRHTSVANVNLIGSLVCFVLVPIGFFFFKEKIRPSFFFGSVVAIIGIYLLVQGGAKNEGGAASLYGDMMALLSMLAYSVFLGLVYGFRRTYDTLDIMFFACVGSLITLFLSAFFVEGITLPPNSKEWMIIIGTTLFGQMLGQGVFSFAMGKISSQSASLLLLLSPITGALMGYFILNEALGLFELIGIGVILLGIFIVKLQK